MKKNDLTKRRCRYRIVLEEQTDEQTDGPKKSCVDPGIVSGSPDLTDRKKLGQLRIRYITVLKWRFNRLS